MKLVGDFLSKFQSLSLPNDAARRAVAEAVRAITGVPAEKKDISIASGVAFVRCSSVAKNAIRLQRADVLTELYRVLPKARELVRDVR